MSKQQDIFLVAHYSKKPKPGVNTAEPGWMDKEGNVQYDEKVEITRGLKKNSIDAKVVLNLSKKAVSRNSWQSNRSFDELFRYFFEGYSQYITAVMKQLDSDYLLSQIDHMQQELDKESDDETDVQSKEETSS